MTDDAKIKQFVNDVYLTKFNRRVDTLLDASPDEDAIEEIFKVARWTSMFCEELELETDDDGRTINWDFIRDNDIDLGTITSLTQNFTLPTTYRRLVVSENRPLTITQDGTIITSFDVVDPNQITRRLDRVNYGRRVTTLGNKIIFSRKFRDTELNGHIIADVLRPIPRLSYTSSSVNDASIFTIVPYYELLVLGVAKNATLPGIVEGGLSPALSQKYADLLGKAKANNQDTSVADEYIREDFSGIIGV